MTPRKRPPRDLEVMVRVSPQHLGRAAMCPIAGCGGGLRIESVDGYPVDICTKCERRLQLWTTLEARLKSALAKVAAQEERAKQAEIANLELQNAIDAMRLVARDADAPARRRGPGFAAQVLAVLEASPRALEAKEVRAALPSIKSARLGPLLNYLVHVKKVRRTALPWGQRSKFKYSARQPAAVSHGD